MKGLKVSVTPLVRRIRDVSPFSRGKSSRLSWFICSCCFILLILPLLTSCEQKTQPLSLDKPVEPLVAGTETQLGELNLRGRFSVLNPEMKVFSLSLSDEGESILFSSEARTISKLDDEGNLCWEISSSGLPVLAALAADGAFAAVGTDQGEVYFVSDDGRILWEKVFPGEIKHIMINCDCDKLLLSVTEETGNILYCLDRWGSLLWERQTGSLLDLFFVSEEEIYYLEEGAEQSASCLIAVRQGELIWEKEALIASFSVEGTYFAIYTGSTLEFYNLDQDGYPDLLWTTPMGSEQEINWLGLTEEGRCLLAYNTYSLVNNNFWAYNREGSLIWEQRIPGGALLDFSFSGERVVASSWQEYSEDFSKVIVFNGSGKILQEFELASRIEKIDLSGDGNILALAGNDSNLFILEIPVSEENDGNDDIAAERNENDEEIKSVYLPVAFERIEGERYITLFFFDEKASILIPVNRSVKNTVQVLQTAVNELVKGPRRYSSLSRIIPKEAVIEVTEQEGLIYLNLPAELSRLSNPVQLHGLVDSLVLTISQFSSVNSIQFLFDGEKIDVLGEEEINVEEPFPPRRPADKPLLYIPCQSGVHYYLVPQEITGLQDPESIVNMVILKSAPFLPGKPHLKEIYAGEREIVLDWGASFAELFPLDADSEKKALSELFIDALLLTLTGNMGSDHLTFLVEGEPFLPPEGYTFSTDLKRPYYINPE